MDKYLLIDIGNSVIKTSTGDGLIIGKVKCFQYDKKYFRKVFLSIIKSYNKSKFQFAGVSSLNLNNNNFIQKTIKNELNIDSHIIGINSKSSVIIDYERTLGNDRFCSASGAYVLSDKFKNILVVDFGTATTYNLILNGVYKGGMISPGIKTAYESLIGKTTLPKINIKTNPLLVSKKTKDNINAGVFYSALFTFQCFIDLMKKKYKTIRVYVTGGLANMMKLENCFKDVISEPYLVLKGINFIVNMEYESLQQK